MRPNPHDPTLETSPDHQTHTISSDNPNLPTSEDDKPLNAHKAKTHTKLTPCYETQPDREIYLLPPPPLPPPLIPHRSAPKNKGTKAVEVTLATYMKPRIAMNRDDSHLKWKDRVLRMQQKTIRAPSLLSQVRPQSLG